MDTYILYADDYVMHVGKAHDENPPGRGSGRYAYGSGKDAYQHNHFIQMVNQYRAKGLADSDIAKAMGFRTATELKSRYSNETNRVKESRKNAVLDIYKEQLKSGNVNKTEIARRTGESDTTIGDWIRAYENGKISSKAKTDLIVEVLKKQVEDKQYIDVSAGVELQKSLNCSESKLKAACDILSEQGYHVHKLGVPNASNPSQKKTWVNVLTKDDVSIKTLSANMDKVRTVDDVWVDTDHMTARMLEKPVSLDSSRVHIRYADEVGPDGHKGVEADGCMYIRPGVTDLSLGNNHFAQVRIAVDGKSYLKGMATYGRPEDFPKGVDIIFNTNKKSGTDFHDVLKPLKKDADGNIDWDNPFGATIKVSGQYHYKDKSGKDHLSPLNIVNDQDDWGKWTKALPSQFLGKQTTQLASKQLKLAYESKLEEYKSIMSVESPAVRKYLLSEFASGCDSAAVHLKAAPLPRQATHVILPVNDLKENEIFAPDYKNGEKVALVRYPHAGRFEIPILTVNNNSEAGRRMIGMDNTVGVGINHKVAAQLSGADFDGDTVTVIPTNHGEIKNSSPLKGLKDFDTMVYVNPEKGEDGKPLPTITKDAAYKQMGIVSNLITDMQLQGATDEELLPVVKHSMVIIDAEKHRLLWKQSEKDANIEQYKRIYQRKAKEDIRIGKDGKPGKDYGGAATLLSRSKSEWNFEGSRTPVKSDGTNHVKRINNMSVDPDTGKIIWDYHPGEQYEKNVRRKVLGEDGKPVLNGKGKPIYETAYGEDGKPVTESATRRVKSTKMAETDDARTLMSGPNHEGTEMERIYAAYANSMKMLGNNARKQYLVTPDGKKQKQAEVDYGDAVESLNNKLKNVMLTSVDERRANMIATKNANAIIRSNPDLRGDTEGQQKIRRQCLATARATLGTPGKEKSVKITDREYEAIKAGALSDRQIKLLLRRVDDQSLKEIAMPRMKVKMTDAKIARAKALLNNGYTIAQVAEFLGVSTSTISKQVK